MKTLVFLVFSSPEPNAHLWAYRIGRPQSSPSVCLSSVCRPHSLNIFSLETTGPIKVKFHMGERNFVQTVLVTWPRWPSCPYMVKTLKKSFSPELKCLWPWNLVCNIGCSSTTKFFSVMTHGWPLPTLRPENYWSSCIAHLSAENMLKSAVIEEK